MRVILDVEHFKKIMIKRLKNGINIDKNNCWIWQKKQHPDGYGVISYYQPLDGSKIHLNTHRVSWFIHKGEIPEGMRVCHNCPGGDVPQCCNPEHLFLGTAKDNTQDMIKKRGTSHFIRGEKTYNSVLTEKIVLEMREMKKKGFSVVKIAEHFKVKYFTCLDVINRRNWRHI